MSDITEQLKRQAAEIASAGHNGWGNTMLVAAFEIELLRHAVAANNGERNKLWGKVERLEKQLSDRDAALARCVEAIKEAYSAGYGKAHNDTVEGLYSPQQSADDYIEEIEASLPTSAQATAKARPVVETSQRFNRPGGPW